MSAEDVKLVGLLQPPPDQDLAALYRSDDAMAALLEDIAPMVDPAVEVRLFRDGKEETFTGLKGLRAAWLAALEPWVAYRARTSKLIDFGKGVLVVTEDFGRAKDAENEDKVEGAAIWWVVNGRVTGIDFYAEREPAFKAAAAARG